MNDTWKDSNGKTASPDSIFPIICLLNVPLMLTSILCNALVLAAIQKTPSIRSTSMIFLCSLAVSDFFVGAIGQPIYIADLLTKNSFISQLAIMVGFSVCTVSLLTIAAISVDRLLAVHFHLRYATLVTKSRVKHILVVIWLISFIVSGFNFWNKRVYHLLLAPVIFICLIISTCCHIRIYQIVRRHQSVIQAQQRSLQSNNNDVHEVELRKSALNSFVLYIALFVCYSPAYVLLTLNGLLGMEWQPEWNFATTLIFVNSAVNPFLYFWRLPKLRKAVVNIVLVRRKLCDEMEENEN